MPFLNIDDNFAEHPKVDRLSDGAFRLHTAALCYCARHLTNGFVDETKAVRLVPRFRAGQVVELVSARLWIPTSGGHLIHDYLDWNRSREQVEEAREKKRKAGKKGAENRWHP